MSPSPVNVRSVNVRSTAFGRSVLGSHLIAAPVLLALVGCGSENDFIQDLPDYGNPLPPPIEDKTQTDRIVQVTTPKVDILWTIDNSCSMLDEQNDLADNFPLFMNFFIGSGLDYHVGVTSTDIDGTYNGADGKLRVVAGVSYLDPDTPSPIDVFVAMASMGTTGSGNEKGMGGTYQALEDNRDTWNQGFYRDEASLHTIVISDEPDNTPSGVVTEPEFINWYDSLKDDTDLRTFSAIIDPSFHTYPNLVNQIGGIQWDVHDEDWPQVLESLGVQAAGLKREYFLSHQPVEDTIAVSVEDPSGAELNFTRAIVDPETGEVIDVDGDQIPDGDWVYDHARNSVTFLSFIPTALSTVVINYTLLASQIGFEDEG